MKNLFKLTNRKLISILILLFIGRIILTFLFSHSDAVSFYYWGKHLWENGFLEFLGKGVPNAMDAYYPPLAYYLLFLTRGLYVLVHKVFWQINLIIPAFPSNFIFWLETEKVGFAINKLPGIISDFGIAFLIYLIVKKIGQIKLAIPVALAYLATPAVWYNSSLWGQNDSFCYFFVLLSFWLLLRNKILLSMIVFSLAIFTKQIVIIALPVFSIFLFKKAKLKEILLGILLFMAIAFILYFPFQPVNTLPWALNHYIKSFQGEINYMVANAFNFWALLFGFDNRPDTSFFFGLPLFIWGRSLFIIFAGLILFKLLKLKKDSCFFIASFLLTFAAFLFMPKMHERYFYPALVFGAVIGGFNKKWYGLFWLISIIHFLNLYHFWWFPRISFLIAMLSNLLIVKSIIIVSLAIFIYFLFQFLRSKNDSFYYHR